MTTHRRVLLVGALLASMAVALGPGAHPAPANAATTLSPTPDAVETTFVNWINSVRASKGLVALRTHPGLVKMAGDWAAHSASTGVLALPSCTSCMLTDYGVQKYTYGSMESWSTYNWGADAINSIESGWKQHSTEWAKLMSSTLNYVGIGVAYRSSNRSMWVVVFETESKDRTTPWSKTGSASRSGSTVSWSWSGGDTKLQSHTAGLKNFDVQYRVDDGTWTTIKSGTTAKSLSLSSRSGGHYYGIRVRSRDNRDYVSGWSAEMRVWVP
ncbi:MAG TPA: CAP domain-containing protein [Candidatus Limnocylindrales bacterium]|nr:CAP domain-containing protein [Candidatus Limnocylindrales bacterium]